MVVILTLSSPAIRDYLVCSLFYDYRYQQKEHEVITGRELMAQRFENTLKKVASYFFYKKQAGVIPSYNALLSRWEKLWFPKDMTAYDMAVEQHETAHGNLMSYSNVAAASLEAFYQDFSEDESDPLLIDESFLIPFDDDIRIEVEFDLTLRKDGRHRVVKWSGRQRRPGAETLMWDFAALRFAFEHRNETPQPVDYSLYDLASANRGYLETDQPTNEEVNALLYWAKQIEQDNAFVPRRGFTAYCRGCPFDKLCESWSDWPKGGDA